MQQIVSYFWQICLLQAGPEQVPGSRFVLAFTMAAYACVALITLVIGDTRLSLPESILSIIVGLAIEAGLVFGLLASRRLQARFNTTMSALLGTNAIVLIVPLPLTGVLLELDAGMLRAFFEALYLTALIWWLAISGYILHRAAGISLTQGILISFSMEILSYTANYYLMPPAS